MATSDRALGEFLSEGQEICDALNHNLLQMDEGRKAGADVDPEAINECFRGVHSLKGLSGMFGFVQMTEVAHTLESLLDSLRLGRTALTPAILDLLFEAVEVFGEMFSAAADGKQVPATRVADYLRRVEEAAAISRAGGGELDALSQFKFPPNILSVLTEYEEHRLVENIKKGRTIYQMQASFDLMTIDTGLEQLKERVKSIGEVITYLPSADSIDDTTIQLDVLVGATVDTKTIRETVDDDDIEIIRVPRVGERAAPEEPAVEPEPKPEPAPAAEPAPVAPKAEPQVALESQATNQAESIREVAASAVAAADAPALDDSIGTIRSVSQTVRVDIRKLDALMNAVSELTIAHAGIQQILQRLSVRLDLVDEVRDLTREVRSLERRLGDLQGGILEVRMVPLRQVFDKLSRVVRKVSRESGKEIRLEITGADTELDKLIVEELSDPLMHIIRNAIDHGIELPGPRQAAGKPGVGTVRVSAKQEGSRVVVTVADDGTGIDEQRVAQAAVSRGLVSRADVDEMGRRELLNLLFLPGMSTRDHATELSGRGVGLDVVKTNIARLSGIIDVSSTAGVGTEFVITLPITLAIIQALVIGTAGRTYAVPLNSVMESLVIEPHEVRTVEGREVYSLRNHTLVLARLDHVFRLGRPEHRPAPSKMFVVVIGLAQHRLGLIVDELVGERDIVIKALGSTLSKVPGIAGATELGHQHTVLVLDVPGILEEALRLTGSSAEAA